MTKSIAAVGLTATSLVAFAANSLLCRVALGRGLIDPVSFTSIRLIAGAGAMLILVHAARREPTQPRPGSWTAGLALFAYAITFSWAYVSLNAATGALILFGAVQLSMLVVGLKRGERLGGLQWLGVVTAAAGLAYLLFPGAAAPSAHGAALMVAAGVAWGAYTLAGRGVSDPLAATAANFTRAALPAVLVSGVALASARSSALGALLAATSGAVTSGVGYAIWYRALRHHSAVSAAIVQLAVPLIAAAGGASFLGETPSARLLVASLLILGGIAATLLAPRLARS